MKPKHYQFISHWRLTAPAEDIWQALADPLVWPKWWPALEHTSLLADEINQSGAHIKAIFRAPLGYRLALMLRVTELDHLRRTVFESTGDLAGSGQMLMQPVGDATQVTITWNVATTKPWMNRSAVVLSLLFRWSHAAVMRSGEIGLKRYLAN